MYIKFLKHGQGDPRKAAAYLISDFDHNGDKRAGVTVLDGDPEIFSALASSVKNKWLYTSGVIAWSKSDNPSNSEILEVLEAFKKHAFSGLEDHQFHITNVLHEEADGSKHVHFLVPRIELSTGKALNIAPPNHEKYFDPIRDYFNLAKGWSRPDSIEVKRDIKIPNTLYLKKKNDVKKGVKTENAYEIVGDYIENGIKKGIVKNRNDVVMLLKEIGEVKSSNDTYISLKPIGAKKAIRLKGAFYEREFNIESYIADRSISEPNATTSTTGRRVSKEHERLASIELERVIYASRKRAEYNKQRYKHTSSYLQPTSRAVEIDAGFDIGAQQLKENYGRSRSVGQESSSGFTEAKYNTHQYSTKAAEHTRNIGDIGKITTTESAIKQQNHKAAVSSNRPDINSASNNSNHGEINEYIEQLTHRKQSKIRIEASIEEPRAEQDNQQLREINNRITEAIRLNGTRKHSVITANQLTKNAEQEFTAGKSTKRPFDIEAGISSFKNIRNAALHKYLVSIRENHLRLISTELNTITDRIKSQNNGRAATKTITGLDFDTFSRSIGEFYKQYNRNRKLKADRARAKNQQINRVSESIDVMIKNFEEGKIKIQLKSAYELAEKLRNYNYSHKMLCDISEHSTKQDNALEKDEFNNLLNSMSSKYISIDNFLTYPNNRTEGTKQAILAIVKNDERIIASCLKNGLELQPDDFRLSKIKKYKLEMTESCKNHEELKNQSRHEYKQVEQIIVSKPKSKPKDNGFDFGM